MPQLKKKTKQLYLDSLTRVNPSHKHGLGLWGNPRVVMGIRVDKGLKKAFTNVAKAKFGSTCNPIESFMAGVVGSYYRDLEAGVNPSNTVNIGEIRIERNLRERRKMTVVTETVEYSKVVSSPAACFFCGRTISELSKVEYISGLVAPTCHFCLERNKEKKTVKQILEDFERRNQK
jgi:hypothetical protein